MRKVHSADGAPSSGELLCLADIQELVALLAPVFWAFSLLSEIRPITTVSPAQDTTLGAPVLMVREGETCLPTSTACNLPNQEVGDILTYILRFSNLVVSLVGIIVLNPEL